MRHTCGYILRGKPWNWGISGEHLYIADDPQQFAEDVIALLNRRRWDEFFRKWAPFCDRQFHVEKKRRQAGANPRTIDRLKNGEFGLSMRTALVTGVNGQDGSFLTELLLNEGYRVVGTTSHQNTDRRHMVCAPERIKIVETSPADHAWMECILREYKPTEVYNLAARASSSHLWSDPIVTAEQNGRGCAPTRRYL